MGWQQWELRWGASGEPAGRSGAWTRGDGRAGRRGRRHASGPTARDLEGQVKELKVQTEKLKAQLTEARKAKGPPRGPETAAPAVPAQPQEDLEARASRT